MQNSIKNNLYAVNLKFVDRKFFLFKINVQESLTIAV